MDGSDQLRSEEGRLRRPWTAEEVSLVVADYLSMFEEHLVGDRVDKTAHRSALSKLIRRSDKSIEFKHCNISAVLSELGLPWLPGYAPLHHYQRLLVEEVAKRFGSLVASADAAPVPRMAMPGAGLDAIFVPRPDLPAGAPRIEPLERLVRKFDPAERDERNRTLGRAGEEFVVEVEGRRLHAAGRRDLVRDLRWVSRDDGDGAGYDVRSFDPETGRERLIEVKTTRGVRTTPFFLTRNEEALSRERPAEWRLYRVFEFAAAPRIFTLAPPLDRAVSLTPATWSASFR